LYYNIKILWDHRRICGPSLTETSLCGDTCIPFIGSILGANFVLIMTGLFRKLPPPRV